MHKSSGDGQLVRPNRHTAVFDFSAWVEPLRDEHIVTLIKVGTSDNLADLNSKLLNAVRFEYLMNKIMVRKELLTPKAAASMRP